MTSEIILPKDAAHLEVLDGVSCWITANGKKVFVDDVSNQSMAAAERHARYIGCTHQACTRCGKPIQKFELICHDCLPEHYLAIHKTRHHVPWDGKSALYSEKLDEWFASPDELYAYAEDHGIVTATRDDFERLRIVVCQPNYATINPSCFDGWTSESLTPPQRFADAIDEFNKTMEGFVISWTPTNLALEWDDPAAPTT